MNFQKTKIKNPLLTVPATTETKSGW